MQREAAYASGDRAMEVAAVSDDGRVVIRFFGGSSVELSIPSHLVPYYRRLLRAADR
jgi:hypothetical protein